MKQRWLLILVFTIVGFGCKNDSSQIPNVAVYMELNINLPEFIDLAIPSGWTYVSGGSNGVVIYRSSLEQFIALDRHSPYNVYENCKVEVDETGIILADPCSGSEFSLIDGSILTGPATAPLKSYNTTFNPPILTVYN